MSTPLHTPEDPRCAHEPPHPLDLLAKATVLLRRLTENRRQVHMGGAYIKFETALPIHQAEAEVFAQIDFLEKGLHAHIEAEAENANQ